jgi:hypothetical protein
MRKSKEVLNSKFSILNSKILLPALVFCWPFLYLYNVILPWRGQYLAIGNDFISLYYRYKIYLLANLESFHLPLWSPSEGAGFVFYTNPFAQAFYPLNVLLVLWYKLLGGYNTIDHQLFTIFGISVFAFGLFMWLKLLNRNLDAVVFATLVMSVSFKVTEIIRFPNAVHTAAWYPWILYAITAVFFSKSIRAAAGFGILLCFSFICLCTGGYPYYTYYSQFLLGPYLIILLIKPLRIRLISCEPINWKRALIILTLAGVIAGVLCVPYILGVKNLMAQTTDRGGKDFAYSTSHIFNITDTAGSLVYPPAASAEGWYFFSITALLIILLYLFLGRRKIQNVDESTHFAQGSNTIAKFFLLGWIATVAYIGFAGQSYLFKALWSFYPGFTSLRNWGRINIVLVPLIAWLLSMAYAWFEEMLRGGSITEDNKKSQVIPTVAVLAGAYVLLLGVQLYFYLNNVQNGLWTQYFNNLSPNKIWFIIYGAIAATMIMLLVIISSRGKLYKSSYLKVVTAILILLSIIEMRHTAIHIWTRQMQWNNERFKPDMAQINKMSFKYPRIDQSFTISLNPVFSIGVIDNWYFDRYVKFLKRTENEIDARRILLGVQGSNRIFFSESVQHPDITSFLKDAGRFVSKTGQLVFYDGDELKWEIDAPVSGYLSFIDNWEQSWKCFVDDKPVEIELLFGTFKSVHLAAGRHNVRFCYRPALIHL